MTSSFFLYINTKPVVWTVLGDPFVSQNSREFNASHFLGRILVSANIIWLYGQV